VRVLTKRELAQACELIGRDHFCADIAEIFRNELKWLDPQREISTLEYSVNHRLIRQADGTTVRWRLDLTPYLAQPMNALDDPSVNEVLVMKPARSGGTVVAENYALKMMDYGPSGDIGWYLSSPPEVASYADRVFKPLFEDHERVSAKIGIGVSENKLTMKRIGGYTVELLPMNARTTTNRQFRFGVFDEPDSYDKRFASNFLEQGRQRQRMIGSQRKIYACAHPDIGWSGGIAQAFMQSSKGIFVMACAECGGHASAYPTKLWPDIARFRLHYQKSPEREAIGERLKRAEGTAAMLCPHCGALLDDGQRRAMVASGDYMHAGQTLDTDLGILGEMDPTITMGFAIHALMVSQVTLGELAKELEGAVEHSRRTGKKDKLKQVLVRTFGEVYEGASGAEGFDASELRKRTRPDPGISQLDNGYRMGEVPDGVRFLTAQVDVGGNKFDVLIEGWDLERRKWLVDRFTIRQRRHDDGVMRDIRPDKVQEDWDLLEAEVIDRLLPLQSSPDRALPVALTVIDTGDGKVTWLAYEFARRMDRKRWDKWRKVRCIKGMAGKRERVPSVPTKISKDSNGKAIAPEITLHVLGVDHLKRDVITDLATIDGTPGQWSFAVNTPSDAFDEFFGETEQEGKFVRTGPNETLDLAAYGEAAFIILEPSRANIRWDKSKVGVGEIWNETMLPLWARSVSLTEQDGGDDEGDDRDTPNLAASRKTSPTNALQKFERLSRG